MEEAAIDMRIACCCAVALFAVAVAAVTDGCSSSPPISVRLSPSSPQTIDQGQTVGITATLTNDMSSKGVARSEEHTSELQSRGHLVCRLLLEKKNFHI